MHNTASAAPKPTAASTNHGQRYGRGTELSGGYSIGHDYSAGSGNRNRHFLASRSTCPMSPTDPACLTVFARRPLQNRYAPRPTSMPDHEGPTAAPSHDAYAVLRNPDLRRYLTGR